MRILVVEDNLKVAGAIRKGLVAQGYAVDLAERGADAEEAATGTDYDVIVLDLMLPDRHGVDVCRTLRKRGVTTPILMLTALSGTRDRVGGLNAGADDFLSKPFDFEELLARVRALLRRGRATESTVLRYADLEMDLYTRTVVRGGARIALTAKELGLLEYFMRNPERVLSRAEITEHVWDRSFESVSNVIDVYVGALRRKIDKGAATPLIHTKIGAGYMLSAGTPG